MAAVLLAACISAEPPQTAPLVAARSANGVLPYWGAPEWREEWSNGIDPDRWTVRDGSTLSIDSATHQASNVTVRDGKLVITGKREQIKNDKPYTTGYLDTIGKFARQFGRWEIRCKVPTVPDESRGLWPAFWLRGERKSGELDVAEWWGTPVSSARYVEPNGYTVTVHEDTHHSDGTNRISVPIPAPDGVPLSEGFHTYAVEWTPETMVFLLDGKVVTTVTNDPEKNNYENAGAWFRTAFDDRFNIRLNMQIGGQQGEPDENTIFPAEYAVDYIRYWRVPGN